MAQKTVYVELVAETRKLRDGLKNVDRKVSKTTQAFKRLGLAIGAAFSARAIFQSLKGTLLEADQLIKTARAVGVAADEYERLSFVIEKRLGGSVGTTERLFKFLQVRLGDTARTYDKYFREVGLDPDALRGQSPSQQALSVIAALSQIENATTRTSVASRILGEEVSLQVLKVASAGEEAIRDAVDDFDRIGVVLGRSGAAKSIEEITDEAANLERQFQVLKQTIVVEAGPGIIEAMQAVADSDVFSIITSEITELITEVNALIDDVRWLGEALDGIKVPDFLKDALRLSQRVSPGGLLTEPFKAFRGIREAVSPSAAPPTFEATGGKKSVNSYTQNVYQNNTIKLSPEEEKRANAIRKQLEKMVNGP